MSVFVAAFGGSDAPVALPEACVSALVQPGAREIRRIAAPGFAAAVAATRRAECAVCEAGGIVAVGDVRLDARVDLVAAIRAQTAAGDAPGGLHARVLAAASAPAGTDDLPLVVAAWLVWGESAFERLRGDFSLVVWDTGRRRGWAARDGLGVRPMHYATAGDTVLASNVLGALRRHPRVPAALHVPAVASFLAHGANLDVSSTTFAAIASVAPGEALAVSGGAARLAARHWTIPDPAPIRLRRDEEYVERYRELLGLAVADRIDADGTVLFLSGGLDSPTIAATARRVAPTARIEAVTMRATNVESPREIGLAAAVAERLALHHRCVESTTDARPDAVPPTPEPLDEPEFGAQCAMLAALTRAGEIMIEGEDGDALFRPAGLRTMLRADSPLRVFGRIVAYAIRHRHHPYLGFWLARRLGFRPGDAPRPIPPWLRPAVREAIAMDTGCVHTNRARPEGAASLTTGLWQSVHAACDRGYHGAAAEFRWPLLDARLIEFVFAIPSVPWCQRKHLARRAFAADLPPDVITRPKTTVHAYHETLVREWRTRTGCAAPPLDPRTLEFVNAQSVAARLRTGDAEDVMEAWRVLELDGWIRSVAA